MTDLVNLLLLYLIFVVAAVVCYCPSAHGVPKLLLLRTSWHLPL
jgi:hypothetical protein